MKVGLTYDLRSTYIKMGFSEEETAELDKEETIEAIESAIISLGYVCERIGNIKDLVEALATGKRWDLVFNIAEGMFGIGREAQVPALLDAYRIPYTFSDPLVLSLTLHKAMTKRVLRDAGVPTSDFFVASQLEDLAELSFSGPYFVKPVAEGTSKGVDSSSIVKDRALLPQVVDRIIKKFKQPALIEPYLSGREFTVGIIGTGKKARIIGTLEVILRSTAEEGVYSYLNKEEYEKRVEYHLVEAEQDGIVQEAETIALSSWRILGCRDAGRVDIKCTKEGIPLFLEVNPLAGLHPKHSDLPILCRKKGITYLELIQSILNSALNRVKL
ncbi:MAG: ATP-grasp enzyme, D-alanine-D-alanine ligase [Desulfonauticus sp. 38_4375]|nr:MAG: ATP-grasp enzyme, D-alanine-D-alanine ligase [Desulfonauticus sp. 38_4375]